MQFNILATKWKQNKKIQNKSSKIKENLWVRLGKNNKLKAHDAQKVKWLKRRKKRIGLATPRPVRSKINAKNANKCP